MKPSIGVLKSAIGLHFWFYINGKSKGYPTMLIREISHPDFVTVHLI